VLRAVAPRIPPQHRKLHYNTASYNVVSVALASTIATEFESQLSRHIVTSPQSLATTSSTTMSSDVASLADVVDV